MYRERDFSPSSSPRTLPRPGWEGRGRSRAKSPVVSQRSHHNFSHQRPDAQRPHLSLLLCPEFEDDFSIGYTSPSSPNSCSPALGRRFPHQQQHHATSLPRPHALARARGAELLQTCASLPCSPTLTRLGGGRREQVGRELSLPSSPLPRIQIVHCDAQVRSMNTVFDIDEKKVHRFGFGDFWPTTSHASRTLGPSCACRLTRTTNLQSVFLSPTFLPTATSHPHSPPSSLSTPAFFCFPLHSPLHHPRFTQCPM